MMAEYLPLEQFKAIYVVDLCKSLCDQARKKVADKGWKNVHVVEGDACTFAPPHDEKVTLVTFSYSLSSTHADPLIALHGLGHNYMQILLPLAAHYTLALYIEASAVRPSAGDRCYMF